MEAWLEKFLITKSGDNLSIVEQIPIILEDVEHIDNIEIKFKIVLRISNMKWRSLKTHELRGYTELRFAVMDIHRLRDHLDLKRYFKSFIPDKDGQNFESWAVTHSDVIRAYPFQKIDNFKKQNTI